MPFLNILKANANEPLNQSGISSNNDNSPYNISQQQIQSSSFVETPIKV